MKRDKIRKMQKKLKEKYICSNSGGWLTRLEIAAAVLLCGLMMPGNVMAAENSENFAGGVFLKMR